MKVFTKINLPFKVQIIIFIFKELKSYVFDHKNTFIDQNSVALRYNKFKHMLMSYNSCSIFELKFESKVTFVYNVSHEAVHFVSLNGYGRCK